MGRWTPSKSLDDSMESDWSCSTVRFQVKVPENGGNLTVKSTGRYLRINATVVEEGNPFPLDMQSLGSSPIWKAGGSFINGNAKADNKLEFKKAGNYTVVLVKMTQAMPFGSGIGTETLGDSRWVFVGVSYDTSLSLPVAIDMPSARRINIIGASDTAGYCADGQPSQKGPPATGWEYTSCAQSYSGSLGALLAADTSVQGSEGIGLTQNANAKEPWQLGRLTMPGYFPRALQSQATPLFNFSSWKPQLVIISLGGNDYNHQEGHVPNRTTFTDASENFLLSIFSHYPGVTIVNVCGQGYPAETKSDPDNNRCRPCPSVENATGASEKGGHALSLIFRAQSAFVSLP